MSRVLRIIALIVFALTAFGVTAGLVTTSDDSTNVNRLDNLTVTVYT